MKQGKNTCRILKEIRHQIASANDIDYVVDECQYKGDCSGTCPRCEGEVRYLEQQLQHKQSIGKVVSVVGLSLSIAAISTQLSSCGSTTQPAQSNQGATPNEVPSEMSVPEVVPIDEPQTDTQKETAKNTNPTKPANKPLLDGAYTGLMEDLRVGMIPDEDSLSFSARFVDGGEQGLANFIAQHAKMPKGVDSTKQYIIETSITINEDGLADPTSLTYLVITSDSKDSYGDAYPLFQQEIERLIKLMPKWEPARRNFGRNIAEPYAASVSLRVILKSNDAASAVCE